MTDKSPIHIVEASIDMGRFHYWKNRRQLPNNDHAMHCLLRECFGQDTSNRPYPYRVKIHRNRAHGTLYAYSRIDSVELKSALDLFATPLQSKILTASSWMSKPVPYAWRVGRRLGFEIRVCPVSRNKSREQDIFTQETKLSERKGINAESLREAVYTDWLSKKLQVCGADLDKTSTRFLHPFHLSEDVSRKMHGRRFVLPDVTMVGDLTITDEAKFSKMLASGIGRHKAYGYGMLLLRPPFQR